MERLMGKANIEVFKERIADAYDPDVLIDMLGISSIEILDAFEDVLLERWGLFDEFDEYA